VVITPGRIRDGRPGREPDLRDAAAQRDAHHPGNGTAVVQCSDYTSNATTSFYDGGVTATLISNGASNAKPATPARHVLPPRL
jgi:hypothetical protein